MKTLWAFLCTKRLVSVTLIGFGLTLNAFADMPAPKEPRVSDPLATGFRQPPTEFAPGVWWRWINGNASKEGITHDLEEMARKGIHSVDLFDVGGGVAPGDAPMMGEKWRELFRHAVREADRMGVQINVTAAAGWGIGGPWVDEAHATKALRVTETQVQGPVAFDAVLPHATGAGSYYRDVAVLAVREVPTLPLTPLSVTTNSSLGGYQDEKNWPVENLTDGDPSTFWKSAQAPAPDKPVILDFRFAAPTTFTALYVSSQAGDGPSQATLQVSDDGKTFREVLTISAVPGERHRVAFPATTAAVFRLVITGAHHPNIQLAEAWLLRDGDEPPRRPGIRWWAYKSGNRAFWDEPKAGPAVLEEEYPADNLPPDSKPGDLIDLTARLSADGRLRWEAPPGRWTILRFGAVLLGEPPRAMSAALRGGYEADPYSPAAADLLYDKTAGVLVKDVGPLASKALTGIFLDSYEIGASVRGLQGTWTDGLCETFRQRRGYDPLPYFPALARRVVGSRETTNRFLTDWRQTLGELYAGFFARLRERAHSDNLLLRSENGYGSYPFPHIDGLTAFGRTDVPMGEFWFNNPIVSQFYPWADSVRTAASAAHVYGLPLVGAESLTIADGRFQVPGEWKTHLDREFANGMNAAMIHLWSHQFDVTARPGLFTYDAVNANMTWWPMAEGFTTYLARCQFLLRQGVSVADVAWFYGEGSTNFIPARSFVRPELPTGVEFDGINGEVIRERLRVQNHRLVLPNGVSYRYLVLPAAPWRVTPATLEAITGLVRAGATLVGKRPVGSPGLATNADVEVARLTDTLWGKTDTVSGERKVGNGRVVWGRELAALFAYDGQPSDVRLDGFAQPDGIIWCHRRSGDTDLYFVSNQRPAAVSGTITFRVNNRVPELFDPLTGAIRDATAFTLGKEGTSVPLRLEANGSLFVVFRRPEKASQAPAPNFPTPQVIATLNHAWTVQFDPAWGGPKEPVTFRTLEDWSKSTDDRIRFYSGTAAYRATFFVAARQLRPENHVLLDLGSVKDIARVRLNGQEAGIVWTAPWRVEVTKMLRPGLNTVEITVANRWTNRLVGDQNVPPSARWTRTNAPQVTRTTPLAPSGLRGPVTLHAY